MLKLFTSSKLLVILFCGIVVFAHPLHAKKKKPKSTIITKEETFPNLK